MCVNIKYQDGAVVCSNATSTRRLPYPLFKSNSLEEVLTKAARTGYKSGAFVQIQDRGSSGCIPLYKGRIGGEELPDAVIISTDREGAQATLRDSDIFYMALSDILPCPGAKTGKRKKKA